MCRSKGNKNYSPWTLRLKDQSLAGIFMEFQIDEIVFTMPHFFIMSVILAILKIMAYEETFQLLLYSIDLMMYFGVFLVVVKCKKYINYGMLLLYIGRLATIYVQQVYLRGGDETKEDLGL